MDKKPNIPTPQSSNLLKLLMTTALILSISLVYFLVQAFAHHKIKSYTQQTISLPELNKTTPVIKNTSKHTVKRVKDNEWQVISPRSGDTMASIFKHLGLSAQNLNSVLQKNPHIKMITAIKPKQKLQFLINKHQLEKMIVPVNDIQTITVSRVGRNYKTKLDSKKTNSINLYVTGTVKGSLPATAQRLNIPRKLVQQMTDILNKETDFYRSIRAGDRFSLVYEGYYVNDKRVGTGDILAVTYTRRDKVFQAIRHTNTNGTHEYYTPKGMSFKKAFSRYPIKFSHISSTFALSRNHPILHYKRAHKGIDLAAPIGTPIQATGDGVIASIGRHNGYGNMIMIKHDHPYSTVYGHLLRFQKGLSKGSKVKRGQVIGYVGQTGLATGPHCHYELHVNNQPRNPSTTPLPTASPVSRREIASFKSQANTLLARLKLYEEANYAASGKKNVDVG
ncbi:MAG: peptidoglycan DD-metalloendopeptidase family protein [Legionellales bacterium]